MIDAKDFFASAKAYTKKALVTQKDAILNASKMLGDCMDNDGVVQLFGTGHNHAFTMELGYRAGGLMPFHKMQTQDLVLRGHISEKESLDPNFDNRLDIAQQLWGLYNIQSNDMFILISSEGNKGTIIELAKMVKDKGFKLIVVTSLAQTKAATSEHPSGKKLLDYADLVIDNCADEIDTVIPYGDIRINQIASITGNVIAQLITAETYNYLKSNGKDCPILLSANLKGADVHNKELSSKYEGRWNS